MLKLPGVNSKNIDRLMNKGVSLDNLVNLPKVFIDVFDNEILYGTFFYCHKMFQEEIYDIIGNKSDGNALWNILHNAYKTSEQASQNKNIPRNRFGKPMRGKYFNKAK